MIFWDLTDEISWYLRIMKLELYKRFFTVIRANVSLTKNQSLSILAFPDVSIHLSELF